MDQDRPPGVKTIEIELDGPAAYDGTIKVDGIEVKQAVRALDVRARVGDLISVTLDVMAMAGARFSGSAYVGIPTETAELLEVLGWTPPDPIGGVRFWSWFTPQALEAARAGELPADWVLGRALHVPHGSMGWMTPEAYLVEIGGRDVPMAAQGLVCTPVLSTRGVLGERPIVTDWGIPGSAHVQGEQTDFETPRENPGA